VAGAAVALLGGTAFFLAFVNGHYPIRDWLFWIYLKAWACAALFFLACLVSGNALLLRTLRRTLPLAEHVVTSFALGAFAFFVLIFVCGLLRLIRPGLFFAAPLLLIGSGAPAAHRVGRRVYRHLSALRRKPQRPSSPAPLLIGLAGCAAVLLLYFPTLTPENIAYDVRWYHIPIAEHYVARGAVERFAEGWFLGAYPHLASFYFAWALLMPASSYFDRVELIAHLEVVFFLVTMAGIPALVRLLLPRTRAPLAWVAVFLFPGLFAYDSALHGGADHIAALWAIPVFTVLVRLLSTLSVRYAALFAIVAAGAINTKVTTVIVVGVPILTVLSVGAFRMAVPRPGRSRGAAALCLAVCAVTGLAATAPFWLKNWIWYGDPIYPNLAKHLAARPLTPDFQVPLDYWFYDAKFRATRDWQGVREALRAVLDFSFVPHDWSITPPPAPVFGSLFTLLLFCVPFLGRRPRLWLLLGATHGGVFLWYNIHHFERYLQALLPWMAASVTVCLVLLWRLHWALRPLVMGLVLSQMVWGGDAYFRPHAMVGSAPERAAALLSAGMKGDYKKRFDVFESYYAIGRKLPPDATVLLHETHIHWGLQRASVSDHAGTQGGISYVRSGSLAGVYDLLKSMHVTHLVWRTGVSGSSDTLGSDLLFFRFAKYATNGRRQVQGETLARMPSEPPPRAAEVDTVAVFDCGERYANGLYPVTALVKSDYDPDRHYPAPYEAFGRTVTKAAARSRLEQATFAVINPLCYRRLVSVAVSLGLEKMATRGDLELYGRPVTEGSG
jgi:hypothetical protein